MAAACVLYGIAIGSGVPLCVPWLACVLACVSRPGATIVIGLVVHDQHDPGTFCAYQFLPPERWWKGRGRPETGRRVFRKEGRGKGRDVGRQSDRQLDR